MEPQQTHHDESVIDPTRIGEQALRKQISLGRVLPFGILFLVYFLFELFGFGFVGLLVGGFLGLVGSLYPSFVIYNDSKRTLKNTSLDARSDAWRYGLARRFGFGHDVYFEKRRRYLADSVTYKKEENREPSPAAKKIFRGFALFFGLLAIFTFLFVGFKFYADIIQNGLK